LAVHGFGLTIDVATEGSGTVRVTVGGELDLVEAPAFQERLRQVEADAPEMVVLDLQGVRFMDSYGLAQLVAARRRARQSGHGLHVISGEGPIRRLVTMAGANDVIEGASALTPA
jgi:anti-sigma B factor antagonist